MKNIKTEDSEEEEQAVDDPDEKQDSDDEEWQPDAEENTTGRASRRLRNLTSAKKPRLAEPSVSDEEVEDEEDDEDEEEYEEDSGSDESYSEKSKKTSSKRRKSTGSRGRSKAKASEDEEAAPDSHLGKEFVSGAFVILKTDCEKDEKPPIWRIDGNELLQKFLPFESENKTLYKSTITYWGWSEKSKGLYDLAPVSIIKAENSKVLVVEVLKSEIPEIKAEKIEEVDVE